MRGIALRKRKMYIVEFGIIILCCIFYALSIAFAFQNCGIEHGWQMAHSELFTVVFFGESSNCFINSHSISRAFVDRNCMH